MGTSGVIEELLLTVDGSKSHVVPDTHLADLDLKERAHLQEWVIAHPEILGVGTQVLSIDDDCWQTSTGKAVQDRLDVLGIDLDGRLVVAELKRDSAPHSTTMQAVTYAAMVSRLKIEEVADLLTRPTAAHARAALGLADDLDAAAIQSQLETQMGMSASTLRNPRIVLIASDFPSSVTAATVWLSEQGVDISLVRFRPYLLDADRHIVTFSRLFPIPDTEEFTIGRRTPAGSDTTSDPGTPWTAQDIIRLKHLGNTATLALMDLCAEPGSQPVTVKDIETTATLSTAQVRGQLAGLTMLLKNQKNGLGPNQWPVTILWTSGGLANYSLPPDLAAMWNELASGPESEPQAASETGSLDATT
jgi:hypothetical protein